MSTGGDAADQMVRDGIEIVESSVKLSALGAKNLAAIAIALAKDNPKLRGKTNLDRLLKDGKELQVFPLKISDLREFNQQAKQYGILFTAIKEKNGEGELVDILVRAEDVSKLNRVFERMGTRPAIGPSAPLRFSGLVQKKQIRGLLRWINPLYGSPFAISGHKPSKSVSGPHWKRRRKNKIRRDEA